MRFLYEVDWQKVFTPQMSLLEVIVRGTLIYVGLCVLLRLVLKRQAGKLALSDLLVVAVVAGVCRNPLVRDAYSVPDALMVVCVVFLWSYGMDWLSYRFRWVHQVFHKEAVILVQDGEILCENLRRELMTEDRLLSQLRQQGIRDVAEVEQAVMEGSGQLSVIKAPRKRGKPRARKHQSTLLPSPTHARSLRNGRLSKTHHATQTKA